MPVLACTPSVVSVTHEAPRGGLLLDFGTEPASQEGIPQHFVEVPLTGRNPTETNVPLAPQDYFSYCGRTYASDFGLRSRLRIRL